MDLEKTLLSDVFQAYPVGRNFLENYNLAGLAESLTLPQAVQAVDVQELEVFGLDRQGLVRQFQAFLDSLDGERGREAVESITVLGGKDKNGDPETAEITIRVGEVVSIVGPTGSGKSRLLGDIECLAQRDTPTGRQILVNGKTVTEEERFNMEGKLVAQLSQNMNFVMDLSVGEFLEMHAKSRLQPDADSVVERCFCCANELAGEKFTRDTKVTQLSGGQSRALMIADTAYMSISPIVLIDEIENAGIDRRQALELLTREEKIVLMSTHDPLLALRAQRRIVIRGGGILTVLAPLPRELEYLRRIEELDTVLQEARQRLRMGGRLGDPAGIKENG